MNRLLRILYVLLFCSFVTPSFTQIPAGAWDRCWLHTDKSFYVSGEFVWYTLYLPPALKDQPIKVKATLYDAANQPIYSTFLNTAGQTSVGSYYRIPFDQAAGYYSLLFTGFDGRRTHRLVHARIPIYNDLAILDDKTVISAVPPAKPQESPESPDKLQIEVQPPTQPWGTRQRVKLQVSAKEASTGLPMPNTRLSVAITDDKLCGPELMPPTNWIPGPALSLVSLAQMQNKLYYRGILQDSLGQAVSSGLLGAWDVDQQLFYYTKAESDGRFTLVLPDFTDAHQIQFLDTEHDRIRVQLVYDTLTGAVPPLLYTPSIMRYLELSRQRKKIYQLYAALENEVKLPDLPVQSRVFAPDRSLRFADYTTFPSAAMFFQEVTNNVRFTKRRDGFYVRIYNQQLEADFPNPPFFLVDGKITRDIPYIAALKPIELERVDIFYKPARLREYFPGFGNNGVIVLQSLSGRLALPPAEENQVFLLSGLSPVLAFPSLPADKPSIRPLIYWQATLLTDANGQAVLEFETTDDRSTFRIDLRAQGAKGEMGAGSMMYQVE